MNVRRGLFRLWAVASAIFVILVGVASYSNLHDEFRNAYTDWDAEVAKLGGSLLLPVNCAEARGNLESDYTRQADGLCWYETAKFRRLYPEYKDLSNAVLRERFFAKAGKPLEVFGYVCRHLIADARGHGTAGNQEKLIWTSLWRGDDLVYVLLDLGERQAAMVCTLDTHGLLAGSG
jgi:hypothetical protein